LLERCVFINHIEPNGKNNGGNRKDQENSLKGLQHEEEFKVFGPL
jgi:hypothetical protein